MVAFCLMVYTYLLCLNLKGSAQASRVLPLRCHDELTETNKNKRSPPRIHASLRGIAENVISNREP